MSELAKALLQFQKSSSGFEADSKGARSKYASIGAVINNIKQAAHYGLCFTQEVDFEGQTMFVRTVMMHTSGEKRESRYPIWVDDVTNNQKVGGAVTYAKRYALASMFGSEKGVDEADDDGEINGNLTDPPKKLDPDKASGVVSSLPSGATSPPSDPTEEGGGTPTPQVLTFEEKLFGFETEWTSLSALEEKKAFLEEVLPEAKSQADLVALFNTLKPDNTGLINLFSSRKEALENGTS